MNNHKTEQEAWDEFCAEIRAEMSPGDLGWVAALMVAVIVVVVLAWNDQAEAQAALLAIPSIRGCAGGCCQGRKPCDCAQGKSESVDTSKLDVQQLMASGAMAGPYKPTHPVTLNAWQRLIRWFRCHYGWALYR